MLASVSTNIENPCTLQYYNTRKRKCVKWVTMYLENLNKIL